MWLSPILGGSSGGLHQAAQAKDIRNAKKGIDLKKVQATRSPAILTTALSLALVGRRRL